MKHSNVYYICERRGEKNGTSVTIFIPQKNARAVKNDYGLDIFKGKGFRYSEGKTGYLLYEGRDFDDFLKSIAISINMNNFSNGNVVESSTFPYEKIVL